jgi:hypothetical protein
VQSYENKMIIENGWSNFIVFSIRKGFFWVGKREGEMPKPEQTMTLCSLVGKKD